MKKFVCFFAVLLLALVLPMAVCAGEAEVEAEVPAEVLPEEPQTVGLGERLLEFMETYSGEMFSALTLLFSAFLAHTYKRGLLPSLGSALEVISRTAKDAGDRAGELALTAEEQLGQLSGRVTPALEMVEQVCDTVDAVALQTRDLAQHLCRVESDRDRMTAAMAGMAEMLYGIFTSANLPAYAKEQIGQSYLALKVTLGGTEHVTEDEGKGV